MKTKKRNEIFMVLLVILLLVVIATYFVEGRQGGITVLPIGDVFVNYIQSFYYFFDTAIFILVVGGFYGALNKVNGYKKLLKIIVDKIGDNGKLFIGVMAVTFAIVASLTGLNVLLLIFIPFVVSIVLMLGYDKLVALSSTVVATLLGFIGGVFISFKDSTNQYGTGYTTFDKMVGLKANFSNALPICILLFLSVTLLIFYMINHIKKLEKGEIVNELSNSDPLYVEARDKRGRKVKVDYSKDKAWPIALMGGVLLVLLILGFVPWKDLFGLDVFSKFHTWLTKISIPRFVLFGHNFEKYPVFTSLISSNFSAFGEWGSLGTYIMSLVLIALFLLILKFVSKVKFSSLYDGFLYGVKKMLPATMMVMLAYSILVCVYNVGIFETIVTNASKSFGDNVIIGSLIVIVGSITHVDLYYTVVGVMTPIVSSLGDKANLSVYSVMFQSLYGLVQIVSPTSLILVVCLSYLEVPYSSWLKYIWRFVLSLLIVIFVILMILSVI